MDNPTFIKERLKRIKDAMPGACWRSIFGVALPVMIGPVALAQAAEPVPASNVTSDSDASSAPSSGSKDSTHWYLEGIELTAQQVVRLEAAVAARPDDLSSRVKILGYYSLSSPLEEKARAAMQPHILWIIRNRPADEAAGRPFCQVNALIDPPRYKEAVEAWEEQVAAHPKESRVLGNAARFFTLFESGRAEKLLIEAKKLEPDNPEWNSRLGALYALKTNNKMAPEVVQKNATRSLAAYEEAAKAQTGEARFYTLTDLVQVAFQSGQIAKARATAEELLRISPEYRKDWNYGNAVYAGNSVLGLIALSEVDVDAARRWLLAAGDTPGSPQLNSFGPDLSLAQALFERGEDQAVLAFLDKISKFWKSGAPRIKAWQDAIRQGKKPKLDRFAF